MWLIVIVLGHLILVLVYWRLSWWVDIFETLLIVDLSGSKNLFFGMHKKPLFKKH
jgi:hypothetical protein